MIRVKCVPRPAWLHRTVCRPEHANIFFPDATTPKDFDEAKQICAECPVAKECLNEALLWEGKAIPKFRFGVRGGLNPTERYKLAKARVSS